MLIQVLGQAIASHKEIVRRVMSFTERNVACGVG